MMKKMRLFRRITATAMVFAMVGITSAFAASSESYGSMTNGKGEIDHIILNDVLPEEEKLSTKSSASPDTEMVISDSPTNGNGEIKHIIGRGRRGRPKEERELKIRISLSVFPSLYGDIQKIAYVQRRSISELIGELLIQYRIDHKEEIIEYERIKNV